jgi:hypothetical protein
MRHRHNWDPKTREWVKGSERERWDREVRVKREAERRKKALEREKMA